MTLFESQLFEVSLLNIFQSMAVTNLKFDSFITLSWDFFPCACLDITCSSLKLLLQ